MECKSGLGLRVSEYRRGLQVEAGVWHVGGGEGSDSWVGPGMRGLGCNRGLQVWKGAQA